MHRIPTKRKEFDFFKSANSTYPSLHYLGSGYDIVNGNPIGDPDSMVDPGYRDPVVKLTWRKNDEGVTNDLKTLQPLEGWVRPEVSCKQSETVEELNTLSDYQNKLSTDASLNVGRNPFFSFSGSAGYKLFAHTIANKNKKSFMLRTYCIRYVAGLYRSLKWKTTAAFSNKIKNLPQQFDGLTSSSKCSIEVYMKNQNDPNCVDIVKWMEFFSEFGTHVVHTVHLGGKLTNQITIDRSELQKMESQGGDVSMKLKAVVTTIPVSANLSTKYSNQSEQKQSLFKSERITIVIGGKPPKRIQDEASLSEWAESVSALPMPIKMGLTPLSHLMNDNKALTNAYESAVIYYGKIYGMTQNDVDDIIGEPISVSQKLRHGKQVTYAGPPPGSAICPEKKTVMLGWAMHFNVHDKTNNLENYHMSFCVAGEEKCTGLGSKLNSKDDMRIWIMCGDEPIVPQQQVVAEGINPAAVCPEGMIIGLGFGLSLSDGEDGPKFTQIYPCRAGQTKCVMETARRSKKSYVWIACFDKSLQGIQEISNVVSKGTVGSVNAKKLNNDGIVEVKCAKNKSIIGGWLLEVHESMNNEKVREGFTKCTKPGNSCSLKGVGFDGGLLLARNMHAMIGYAACGPPLSEEKPVKTSEEKAVKAGS